MSASDLSPSAEIESKPATPRRVHTIDNLIEDGHGCRATIYNEIAEGRLRALKRGRRTVILEEDRAAWVEGWPRAVVKPDAKRVKAATS